MMILFTIILFILILGLLIFVHELGHFVVAKRAGMRVEEFGFGFPPRFLGIQIIKEKKYEVKEIQEEDTVEVEDIRTPEGQEVIVEKQERKIREIDTVKTKRRWRMVYGNSPDLDPKHTVYSINWIPLGGFVKILGENGDSNEPDAFASKSAFRRFSVLVAGVGMNVVLAWVLVSMALMIGMPTLINQGESMPAGARVTEPQTTLVYIAKNSPAEAVGLKSGDVIKMIDGKIFDSITTIQDYTSLRAGQATKYVFTRGSETLNLTIIPRANPPQGEGPLGVVLGTMVRVSYSPLRALYEGLGTTFSLGAQILEAFGGMLKSLVMHQTLAGSLTGPVGIAVLTRDAARLGLVYVMYFTAVLSLNLAFINALPFPALDGGRIFFLAIEKIRRKKMNLKFEQYANTLGFMLLLLLMVWVTFRDIGRFSPQFVSLWQKITSMF
jgi:regulator of sigma E protease